MNMKILMSLAVFLLALSVAPVEADSHMNPVLTKKEIAAAKELVETRRNMTVIISLNLTEEESEEFWPLYEEYRQKIRGVRERKITLIENFADRYNEDTVDDEFADQAVKDALEIQIDTAKIRQKYWKKFQRIIPATKAARFYQLENKMDAEVDYVLAGGIPLVETK